MFFSASFLPLPSFINVKMSSQHESLKLYKKTRNSRQSTVPTIERHNCIILFYLFQLNFGLPQPFGTSADKSRFSALDILWYCVRTFTGSPFAVLFSFLDILDISEYFLCVRTFTGSPFAAVFSFLNGKCLLLWQPAPLDL